MAIIASTGGSITAQIAPEGSHLARCYEMIHIGTIETEWMGEKRLSNKVRIAWELPTELVVFNAEKGEQPFSISREFTLSMNEKSTLRAFLTAWRGKPFNDIEAENFDISKLLGVPCALNIIHVPSKDGSKTYANIASVAPIMKGVQMPDQINPSFEFSVLEFDQDKFESLPEWLREKIKASKEYQHLASSNNSDNQQIEPVQKYDDDLPF